MAQPSWCGYHAIYAHCGSQCIDLMLVDDLTNPTKVLIFEIKGTREVTKPSWKFGFRVDPDTDIKHLQLSDDWIRLMQAESGLNTTAKSVLQKALDKEILMERYGFFVDGNGNSDILKIN